MYVLVRMELRRKLGFDDVFRRDGQFNLDCTAYISFGPNIRGDHYEVQQQGACEELDSKNTRA